MDETTLTAYLSEALAQSESFSAPGKSQRVLQAMFLSIEMRWHWGAKTIEALGYGALRRLEIVKPNGERSMPQRLPECVVKFIAVDRRMGAIGHLLDPDLLEALHAKAQERFRAYDTAYANRFPGTPAPSHNGALKNHAPDSSDLDQPETRPAAPPKEPDPASFDDEDVDLDSAVEVDPTDPKPAAPPDEADDEDVVIAL